MQYLDWYGKKEHAIKDIIRSTDKIRIITVE